MLWLAVHFPALALEVFPGAARSAAPFAVATRPGRGAILIANAAAARAGALIGMPASAACALVPQLVVRGRDAAAERRALEGAALWAGQFTPLVSLRTARLALLAEIGGGLKLFGGLEALLARVRSGLEELGYEALLACAPTPAAAELLAHAGFELTLDASEAIRPNLSRLPLACLDAGAETIAALESLGLRTLGECLALPADGLARRFGPALVDQLRRALGETPDPQPPFAPPEHYAAQLELPAPAEAVEGLGFGLRRMLGELCGLLATRNLGATALALSLEHDDPPATRVALKLSVPSRDAQHLLALARERLARIELPGRVTGLGLRLESSAQLAPRLFSLFGKPGGCADGSAEIRAQLIERLRARMGETAVCGLQLIPDHRPELAFREAGPGAGAGPDVGPARPVARLRGSRPARPLWLVQPARPLADRDGAPWLAGPLTLDAGPERIASGWWDGHDVRRDYFVARTARGARVWVYRDHGGAAGWFLHGLFA